MVAQFRRFLEGLRPGSGHRAWRITGDYGTGKSAFALVLAHLLRDPTAPTLESIRQAIERESKLDVLDSARMVPVLVTGAREPLVPAIARAVNHTIERMHGRTARKSDCQEPAEASHFSRRLSKRLASLGPPGPPCKVRKQRMATPVHCSYLIELGKFLEYAALHPDHEDVYVLQRLAELAVRSNDEPLVVVGLLHQGFHAYSESLPSADTTGVGESWRSLRRDHLRPTTGPRISTCSECSKTLTKRLLQRTSK